MKVTFIGVGDMGSHMVPHLAEAGHDVTIWDTNSDKMQALVGPHITAAHSLKEAVQASKLIITSVMFRDIMALFFGDNETPGLISLLEKDSTVVVTSTIDPAKIAEIDQAMPAGSNLLDAPMVGGVKYAREGNLVMLVGGRQRAYEQALPILNLFGVVKYIGESGSGAKMKLITNDNIMAAEAGLRETLDLADAYHMDYETVLDLLQLGPLKAVVIRALDENNPRPLQDSVADVDELLDATKDIIPLPLAEAARDRLKQGVIDAGGSARFIDITTKNTAFPRYK